MLDVHFYGRFREWEVAWHVLYFCSTCNFYCKHAQEAQKCAKVYVFSKNDSLCLVKVAKVGCVNLVVAEAAGNTKVFSWYLSLVQLVGAQNGSLTAHNKAAGKFVVKFIVPTAASCVSTVAVYVCHVAKIGFLYALGMGWIFKAVNVVNVAGCVELGHKECISVPEFSFYERAVKFFKSK